MSETGACAAIDQVLGGLVVLVVQNVDAEMQRLRSRGVFHIGLVGALINQREPDQAGPNYANRPERPKF